MAKKAGRPQAAPNKKYDIAEATETKCRCGSTRRAPYNAKVDRTVLQNTYVNPKTQLEYNVIELRTTRCLDCNQARKDRTEVLEEREA
jgi:hypothetical protein